MDKKIIIDMIEDTKKDIEINPEWKYHSIRLNTIESILENGLLCNDLLPDEYKNKIQKTFNGNYYISLLKNLNYSNNKKRFEHKELFCGWYNDNPLLIIDDKVKTYQTHSIYTTKGRFIYHYFINTKLPLRCSCWSDEVQAYKKIDTSHFIGIYYKLINKIIFDDNINSIETLQQIINILDNYNFDIPVIDGSDNKIINKDVIKKIKVKNYK